jgi:hypothetical protein
MADSPVIFPSLSLAFTGAIGNHFAFGTFPEILDLGFDIGAARIPARCVRCGTVHFNDRCTIRARQSCLVTMLFERNVPTFHHDQELGFWNEPMSTGPPEEFSFQVLDNVRLMIVFCDSCLLTDLQQFILLLPFAAFSVQALA